MKTIWACGFCGLHLKHTLMEETNMKAIVLNANNSITFLGQFLVLLWINFSVSSEPNKVIIGLTAHCDKNNKGLQTRKQCGGLWERNLIQQDSRRSWQRQEPVHPAYAKEISSQPIWLLKESFSQKQNTLKKKSLLESLLRGFQNKTRWKE